MNSELDLIIQGFIEQGRNLQADPEPVAVQLYLSSLSQSSLSHFFPPDLRKKYLKRGQAADLETAIGILTGLLGKGVEGTEVTSKELLAQQLHDLEEHENTLREIKERAREEIERLRKSGRTVASVGQKHTAAEKVSVRGGVLPTSGEILPETPPFPARPEAISLIQNVATELGAPLTKGQLERVFQSVYHVPEMPEKSYQAPSDLADEFFLRTKGLLAKTDTLSHHPHLDQAAGNVNQILFRQASLPTTERDSSESLLKIVTAVILEHTEVDPKEAQELAEKVVGQTDELNRLVNERQGETPERQAVRERLYTTVKSRLGESPEISTAEQTSIAFQLADAIVQQSPEERPSVSAEWINTAVQDIASSRGYSLPENIIPTVSAAVAEATQSPTQDSVIYESPTKPEGSAGQPLETLLKQNSVPDDQAAVVTAELARLVKRQAETSPASRLNDEEYQKRVELVLEEHTDMDKNQRASFAADFAADRLRPAPIEETLQETRPSSTTLRTQREEAVAIVATALTTAEIPAPAIGSISQELGRVIDRQISATPDKKLTDEEFAVRVQQVVSEHIVDPDKQVKVVSAITNDTKTFEQNLIARQDVEHKISLEAEEIILEVSPNQKEAAKKAGQEIGRLVVENRSANESGSTQGLKAKTKEIADRAGINLNDQQLTDVVNRTRTTLSEATQLLPLASAAREAASRPHIAAELNERFVDKIKVVLKSENPALNDKALSDISQKIADNFIDHYANPSSGTTELRSGITQSLQAGGAGLPYANTATIDKIVKVSESREATAIRRWISTSPDGLVRKPSANDIRIEDLAYDLRVEVKKALMIARPSLASDPKFEQISQQLTDTLVGQTRTHGWSPAKLQNPASQALRVQGLGVKNDFVEKLLKSVGENTKAKAIIGQIEKAGSVLPIEILTKLETESSNLALSPVYFLLRPQDAVRLAGAHLQSGLVAVPRWAIKTSIPSSVDPEAWTIMANGIFAEDVRASMDYYRQNGLKDPSHPTMAKLESLAKKLEATQKVNGQDSTAVKILKMSVRPARMMGVTPRYEGIPLVSEQRPLWDKGFSRDLKLNLERRALNFFHEKTGYFPGVKTIRFSLERRLITFVSGGRLTSVSNVQSLISRRLGFAVSRVGGRVFGQVGKRLATSALAKTGSVVMKQAAGFLAKRLGMKIALAALGSVVPGLGTAAGLAVGFILDAAKGLIKRAFAPLRKLSREALARLVGLSMVAGGLAVSSIAGLAGAGIGMIGLGAGALASTIPGLASSLSGALGGAASGIAGVLGAITAGLSSGFAGVLCSVIAICGIFGLTVFIVVLVIGGAFLLPTNPLKDFYLPGPWEVVCTDHPPVFPTPTGTSFRWESSWPQSCTSNFGYGMITYNNGATTCRCHKGIDIGINDVDVYPVEKGAIHLAGDSASYGNYVIVDHGGLFTLYGHLKPGTVHVKKGDKVYPESHILKTSLGKSDSGGISTGPHLHLSFADCGDPACFSGEHSSDPCAYLNCPPGCGFRDKTQGCPGP